MSTSRPMIPLPQDQRWQLNHDLGTDDLAPLDENGRFIVRRMVAEAYGKGFEHGWLAGQNDADTERRIERALSSSTKEEQ